MLIAKEQIRQIISGNEIGRVNDVYELLKEGFKNLKSQYGEFQINVPRDSTYLNS